MGNKGSQLKKKQLTEYVTSSNFTEAEVLCLHQHFKVIASSESDDGQIDKREFQNALGLKDSTFMTRMFSYFDADGDNQITFIEFLNALSILSSKADVSEKLKFSFMIYDFDKDNMISSTDLKEMLVATLDELDLAMGEEQIEALVNSTILEADLDKDGLISFSEYKSLYEQHAGMLELMTINVSGIIAEQTRKAAERAPDDRENS